MLAERKARRIPAARSPAASPSVTHSSRTASPACVPRNFLSPIATSQSNNQIHAPPENGGAFSKTEIPMSADPKAAEWTDEDQYDLNVQLNILGLALIAYCL